MIPIPIEHVARIFDRDETKFDNTFEDDKTLFHRLGLTRIIVRLSRYVLYDKRFDRT